MAKIIENAFGRRMIRVSPDDVVRIIQEYQNMGYSRLSYDEMKLRMKEFAFYLPEEI